LRFLTIFPEAENIHLIKDVGMLPYALHKEYGYESTIACYHNGNYPYLLTELTGLKMMFIKRIFGNVVLDVLWFLLWHRSKFDIMQTYHFQFRSLLWLYFFKLFTRKRKTYLKLDANADTLRKSESGKFADINKKLLKHVNLMSVESRLLQRQLEEKWNVDLLLVPNGFYKPETPFIQYENKKNIILTVGRIGSPEKCNRQLIEAFGEISFLFPAWILELTGPVEPDFQTEIADFFEQYPNLKDRIIFTGAIADRNELFKKYNEAKIFCLPSIREGFPLAMVEAASAGCYLISSDFASAYDITDNEKFGTIFPAGKFKNLREQLSEAMANETMMAQNCIPVQHYIKQTFSWKVIAERIHQKLND
jgi:glycosyltransferase involved in cell wall biosynthesis